MAFCPICSTNFPRGARCPEHGGLVENLAPGDESKPTEDPCLRCVTVYSEAMAQSWSQMLRNNGIPTVVKAGGPGFSLGAPPPFGYEIYIYVPRSLAHRACSILEDFAQPGILELEPPEDEG